MSRLSELYAKECVDADRENYHNEKGFKCRRIDLLKNIEDYVKEQKEEFPEFSIVGISRCVFEMRSVNGVGKVYVGLSAKTQYVKDGPVSNIDTSMECKVGYIDDIVEDLDEFFNGEEKKEKEDS